MPLEFVASVLLSLGRNSQVVEAVPNELMPTSVHHDELPGETTMQRVRISEETRATRVQWAQNGWLYGLTFVLPLVLLAIMAMQTVVPIAYLTKDPLAVAELAKGECCSVYYGLLSNFGVLLWCATTAICLFTALLCLSKRTKISDAVFFAAAGMFTGWLMLDDFFLVHEDVLPAFGVSQPLTYAVYAGLAISYFALSWKKIITYRTNLLIAALAFLGTSVVLDVILHSESTTHILLEDGAKILGISAWAAFHIEAAYLAVSKQSQNIRVTLTSPVNMTNSSRITPADLPRGA